MTVDILDKYAWECITEVIRNPEWIRARVAELFAETKPVIDVKVVETTIAEIDTQMANLFALAQHATSQKTIDSLGMMMQTLEKQKQDAEALFYDATDEEEERIALEQEIQGFEAWATNARLLLDDSTWRPTYEEKGNAVRALGVIAIVYSAHGIIPSVTRLLSPFLRL